MSGDELYLERLSSIVARKFAKPKKTCEKSEASEARTHEKGKRKNHSRKVIEFLKRFYIKNRSMTGKNCEMVFDGCFVFWLARGFFRNVIIRKRLFILVFRVDSLDEFLNLI